MSELPVNSVLVLCAERVSRHTASLCIFKKSQLFGVVTTRKEVINDIDSHIKNSLNTCTCLNQLLDITDVTIECARNTLKVEYAKAPSVPYSP